MAVAVVPRIPGLGAQKCFWWGFRKQKVRVGVAMGALWVLILGRVLEGHHWPRRR